MDPGLFIDQNHPVLCDGFMEKNFLAWGIHQMMITSPSLKDIVTLAHNKCI